MAEAFELEELQEKVILVGVSEQEGDDAEDSLVELAELVRTAGAQVVGTLIQKHCASSTWILPSLVVARSAKISRMISVRSITFV